MAISTITIDPMPGEAPPAAMSPDTPPASKVEFDKLPEAGKVSWVRKWSTAGGPKAPAWLDAMATPTPAVPSGKRTITLDPMPTPLGGPDTGTAIESPSRFESWTGEAARGVEHGLKKVGIPTDAAEEVGNILYSAGPHNAFDAALLAIGTLMPFAGKVAPVFDEIAPGVANFFRTVGEAPSLSLKGTAARAGVTGATTGAAAAATGQPIIPSALAGAGMSVVGEVPGASARRQTGLGAGMRGVEESVAESGIKQAQTGEITRQLGVSPERAAALGVESPEAAQQLASSKRALTAGRESVLREKGEKFEPFYGPQNKNPVDPVDINQIHEGSQKALTTVGVRGQERELSAGVRKQIQDLGNLKTMSNLDAEQVYNRMMQDAYEVPREKQAYPELMDRLKALDAERVASGSHEPLSRQEIIDNIIIPQEGTTIGQLRGKLSSLMSEAFAPGSTATERKAIFEATQPITKILDEAVPDELRPALQSVKDEYAQAIRLFPWRQQRAIYAASTLPELGEAFFEKGKPAAMEALIKRMNPEQQSLMRESFGTWLWDKAQADPKKALLALGENQRALAMLFPGTEFSRVGAWADMIRGTASVAAGKVPSLPERSEFMAGVQNQIRRGMTPEMLSAMDNAMRKSSEGQLPMVLRYLTRWGLISGLAGYGILGHQPELLPFVGGYALAHIGWQNLMANPERLAMYRAFVSNPWTKAGGDAFGRLMVAAGNDMLHAPGQKPPAPPPMLTSKDVSKPLGKAVDARRAETIAGPHATPAKVDAIKAAGKKVAAPGKPADVHSDLSSGKLSLGHIRKMLDASSGSDLASVFHGLSASDAIWALAQASPQEKSLFLPVVAQKLQDESKQIGPQQTAMLMQQLRSILTGSEAMA